MNTEQANTLGQTAPYDWMPEARAIAAQCWCEPETSGTQMDPVLAEVFARHIAVWMRTGAQHARDAQYWHVAETASAERIAALEKERDALKAAIATAYGHLWHVNNEPYAPIPIYTPGKAAYAARKVLRELLTSEQRGDAINATQKVWGATIDAAKGES